MRAGTCCAAKCAYVSLSSFGGEQPSPFLDVDPEGGTFTVRPDALAETFLQDCDPEIQREAARKTARQSLVEHSGTLALIYTEALVLELLCCAVKSFSALSGAPTEEYTERELKCLHMARNMLIKQLAPPPTISQLARTVGMGKSTLTKGFKAVFGETILDFSLSCRMRHAMALMRDQRLSVAKASEAAGYAHPTSFTTAFRRYFGMRPIEVRRVKSRDNPT